MSEDEIGKLQSRCKELERDLEATGRAVIARDYRIGGLGEENDNLRHRITELEAEVARLKGELNRFSLTRKIGHTTPQEKP